MLKKEITYTDLNDRIRTEDFYFNMTKAEMLEYDASFPPDGVIPYLTMLMKTEQTGKVMQVFKDLILRSYGEKTDSGRFIKSHELREAFAASEAYSELFMEIISGEEAAAAFVNGIMPKAPDEKKSNVTPIPAPLG